MAPPRVLTIAGSDSGGGAGIQADLKTFAAHGVYGMSVLTAITAQNTREVTAVAEVPVPVVVAQIDAVFSDIGVDAVKIGMLASAALVEAVAERLRHWRPALVVLDPVMVAKSGATLLAADAVAALRRELLPLATVITPNLPEAAKLAGEGAEGVWESAGEAELMELAAALARLGSPGQDLAVLLKGGHGTGEAVVDVLYSGGACGLYCHPRQHTRSTHGTGCTLSSAIAARLALGTGLIGAVRGAIEYLQGAIHAAYPLGHGHGPVDHLYQLFPRAGAA